MAFIELWNVYKKCSSDFSVHIEHLEIDEKGILCLIGANGAGKSTLMRILCGLTTYDSGTILVNGEKCKSLKEYGDILGYVQQSKGLPDRVTLKEFLIQQAIIKNVSKKNIREAMELADLGGHSGAYLGTMSEGNKRKVHIMTAILNKPKLLIMDEPTVGIDPAIRNDILAYVARLSESGMSAIISTHYLDEIQKLDARCVFMKGGRIIFSSTFDQISNNQMKNNIFELVFQDDKSYDELIIHCEKQKIVDIRFVKKEKNKILLEIDGNPEEGHFVKLASLCFQMGLALKSIRKYEEVLETLYLDKIGEHGDKLGQE